MGELGELFLRNRGDAVVAERRGVVRDESAESPPVGSLGRKAPAKGTCLNDYPDHWTQGESLGDLKEQRFV